MALVHVYFGCIVRVSVCIAYSGSMCIRAGRLLAGGMCVNRLHSLAVCLCNVRVFIPYGVACVHICVCACVVCMCTLHTV